MKNLAEVGADVISAGMSGRTQIAESAFGTLDIEVNYSQERIALVFEDCDGKKQRIRMGFATAIQFWFNLQELDLEHIINRVDQVVNPPDEE